MEEEIDPSTKEGLLSKTLMQFFRERNHLEMMIPILTESSPISLRVLDWFVTNYCREHTKLIVKDPLLKDFNVYSSYKSQLKAFNKKLFDPFCRLHSNGKIKKFRFVYDKDRSVLTTTGQLNFFKWAIENRVIDYVIIHHNEIKADLKKKELTKKSSLTSSESPSSATFTESSPPELGSLALKKAYVIRFD